MSIKNYRVAIPLIPIDKSIDTVASVLVKDADGKGQDDYRPEANALANLIELIGTNVEKMNDGSALNKYVEDAESFARAVFSAERIDLTDHRIDRCAQIEQEFENEVLKDADAGRLKELTENLGYRPLRKKQIEPYIYCAARVLRCIFNLKPFITSPPTAARLALECMELERRFQQLLYTFAYRKKHSGISGRDARSATQKKRQEELLALDQVSPITPNSYADLRKQYGINQKTLARDLQQIRPKAI